MTDFIATLNDRMVPAWLRSYQTTLPRIESAQAETGKLEDKVDELQARLDRVQEELPAPNRAVAEVREELGGLEDRLGEMGRNWEEARKDFLGLIPDATDLAYMKLAKAEVTELRGLLTRHLEHDDRERGIKNSEAANRRAWAAIGIAGVGLVVSIIGTVFGR